MLTPENLGIVGSEVVRFAS